MPSMTLTILPISPDWLPMELTEAWSCSPLLLVSTTEFLDTSSTICTRVAIEPMLSIIVVRRDIASSTDCSRVSPFWEVCTRVALICWIDDEVSSTLAASASAVRASACIWAAICTMVADVCSVELVWASAPLAIWTEEAEISSADVATVREEVEIWPTTVRRFLTIWRIECSSHPISSRDWLLMSAERLPFDTCSASMPRLSSGLAISRARSTASARPTATVTAVVRRMIERASVVIWAAPVALLSLPSWPIANQPCRPVSTRTAAKPEMIFRRMVQSRILCMIVWVIADSRGRGAGRVQRQRKVEKNDQAIVQVDDARQIGGVRRLFFARGRPQPVRRQLLHLGHRVHQQPKHPTPDFAHDDPRR